MQNFPRKKIFRKVSSLFNVFLLFSFCTFVLFPNTLVQKSSAFFWNKGAAAEAALQKQTTFKEHTEALENYGKQWLDLKPKLTDSVDLNQDLKEAETNLESQFSDVKEKMTEDLNTLTENLNNPEIETRYRDFLTHYDETMQDLIQKLKVASADPSSQKLSELNQKIDEVFGKEENLHKKNSTPFRLIPDEQIEKRSDKKIDFKNENVFENIELTPSTESSQSKKESPLTLERNSISESNGNSVRTAAPSLSRDASYPSALEDLAEELNYDPLEIYNYVYNEISFTPYYGVKKGAYNTYLERTGNDMDISLLLQDLLEISGYDVNLVRGEILLKPEQAKNWIGTNDTLAAAQQLANGKIPLAVYTDSTDEPVYVLLEHTWIEVELPYQNYRGTGTTEGDMQWIPLDASLKEIGASQTLNALDEMSLSTEDFFENYLEGDYEGTPTEALQSQIENFLASDYPTLSYEDILTTVRAAPHQFEFLPNTLPYSVVDELESSTDLSTAFDHQMQYIVTDTSGTTLLSTTLNTKDVANKQVVLGFEAATASDQTVIDYYGSIYLTPPYLIQVKPVLRVNGITMATGSAIGGAMELNFEMKFLVPEREIAEGDPSSIERETTDIDLKAGNDVAIAINTDRLVAPEFFQEEIDSSEFLNSQKLYKTAWDYLSRVAQNQTEVGQVVGGSYTNAATRAFVFNGVEVSSVSGVPQTFEWTGLRLDSSAVINYFPYFGEWGTHAQDFNLLFGLSSSLDESTIFEDTYDVEAMSTVKGINLINEGSIPGVEMVKLTSANASDLNALNLSSSTKATLQAELDSGHTVYTPSEAFTYLDWTGLVYITLDSDNGDGGYIIGEGLNGGYTVQEMDTWQGLFYLGFSSLTAQISYPTQDSVQTRGDSCVYYEVRYSGVYFYYLNTTWTESGCYDTQYLREGTYYVRSGYGTNEEVTFSLVGDETSILQDFVEALESYVERTGNYQPTDYVCISLLIDKIRDATDKHGAESFFSSYIDTTTTIPDAGADGFMNDVFPHWGEPEPIHFDFQEQITRANLRPGNIIAYDWKIENDENTDEDDEHGSDGYWDHVSAIVDIDDAGYRTYIYSTGEGGVIKRVEETWIRERLAGFESLSAAEQDVNCAQNDSDDNNLRIIPGEVMLLEPDTYSSDYPAAYACVARSFDRSREYNVSNYLLEYVEWSDTVLYQN